MKKGFKKYFMYWLLRQINFFFPTRGSIGILIMDFEGIFDVIFLELVCSQHSVQIKKKSTVAEKSEFGFNVCKKVA